MCGRRRAAPFYETRIAAWCGRVAGDWMDKQPLCAIRETRRGRYSAGRLARGARASPCRVPRGACGTGLERGLAGDVRGALGERPHGAAARSGRGTGSKGSCSYCRGRIDGYRCRHQGRAQYSDRHGQRWRPCAGGTRYKPRAARGHDHRTHQPRGQYHRQVSGVADRVRAEAAARWISDRLGGPDRIGAYGVRATLRYATVSRGAFCRSGAPGRCRAAASADWRRKASGPSSSCPVQDLRQTGDVS